MDAEAAVLEFVLAEMVDVQRLLPVSQDLLLFLPLCLLLGTLSGVTLWESNVDISVIRIVMLAQT